MEENGLDLPELKKIYDELWSDAKALANDMKASIEITHYAAYATLTIMLAIITSAIPHFIGVATGDLNPISLFMVASAIAGAVVLSYFSQRLIRLHNKLKRKYARLIALGNQAG